jgi:hypothetical protein
MNQYERVGLVLVFMVSAPSVAMAYVDPVAGSMLLQLLLGGVAGAYCFIRLLKGRILGRLGFGRKDDKN